MGHVNMIREDAGGGAGGRGKKRGGLKGEAARRAERWEREKGEREKGRRRTEAGKEKGERDHDGTQESTTLYTPQISETPE